MSEVIMTDTADHGELPSLRWRSPDDLAEQAQGDCAMCESLANGVGGIHELRTWWFMPCRNCAGERVVHEVKHPHWAVETVMHEACWGFVPFSLDEVRQEILDIRTALEN